MFTFHTVRPSFQPQEAFDPLERLVNHLRGIEVQLRRNPESTVPRAPAVDVSETEFGYIVTVEVPGVNKEDVRVSIEGGHVRVNAEPAGSSDAGASASTSEAGSGAPLAQAEPSGERVIHRERRRVRFDRTIDLAHEIDASKASAKLENGVLTLTLHKQPVARPATVNVQ